jgi:O-antigen/teichoic acid export membrane protein
LTLISTERAQPKSGWQHTTGTRLILNIFSNFLGQAITVAIAFFSTPYITRKLGADQYGALNLLMVYLFSFSLLNLGINTSLVKYLAALLPKQELQEMQQYLSTSVTVLLGMGIAASSCIFVLASPIAHHFFKGPAELMAPTVVALRISSIVFIFQFLCQVTSAVTTAAQRFDLLNVINLQGELLRVGGTILVIYWGGRLPALMVVTAGVSLCGLIAFYVSAKHLVPQLNFKLGFSRRHLSRLVNHSKYVVVANVSSQAVGTVDSFAIGYFLPISNVAYYGVAATLGRRLWALVGNIATVVFPAASAFSEADRAESVKEIYLRSTKVTAAVVCFPALALALFSPEFLRYWLGSEWADQGHLVLSLIVIGYLLNALTHIPNQVLQGTAYVATAAKGQAVYAVINLSLFLGLIPHFGIRGGAFGFLLSQLLFVPWFVHTANTLVQVKWPALASVYLRVLTAGGISCAVSVIFRSRVHSLFTLGAVITLGAAVYALLAYVMIFDEKERSTCQLLIQHWTHLSAVQGAVR